MIKPFGAGHFKTAPIYCADIKPPAGKSVGGFALLVHALHYLMTFIFTYLLI